MSRLEGQVTLITGGARGQGRAHAVAHAREGARIVVTDIGEQLPSALYGMGTQEELDETVRLVEELDQRCIAIKADARDSGQMAGAVETALAEFGRIDNLIINHGISSTGGWDVDEDAFDEMISVNLKGVWIAAKSVIPHMIERGEGGSIVITASPAGIKPFHGLLAYCTAKAGALAIMRSLAAELAPHSIRANAILPAFVATPMTMNPALMDLFAGKEGATAEDIDLPVRTLHLLPEGPVQPEAIAGSGVFLCSDEARIITGHALPVEAGLLNQPPGVPWAMWDVLGAG